MNVNVPEVLLWSARADSMALFIALLAIQRNQTPEELSMWKNDPDKGVSVCTPILSHRFGLTEERCERAISELKSIGILTGKSPHWQLQVDKFTTNPRNRRPVIISSELRRKILAIGECAHCGTNEELTVDHVVPVAQGGTDDEDNLQPLCRSCNTRKRDRFIG